MLFLQLAKWDYLRKLVAKQKLLSKWASRILRADWHIHFQDVSFQAITRLGTDSKIQQQAMERTKKSLNNIWKSIHRQWHRYQHKKLANKIFRHHTRLNLVWVPFYA